MKFPIPVPCSSCGCDFEALGYGELTFPPAKCPQCGQTIHIVDPLTFSIVTVRLLYRGKAELENGDFTMPIICGAIAIEAALTQLFMKWKSIDHGFPVTDSDRAKWEKQYRDGVGRGGFAREANFVSHDLTGKTFDAFVADYFKRKTKPERNNSGITLPESQLKTAQIHSTLFDKRNRIMHWGKVDYKEQDAKKALDAGLNAFAILTVMDKEKADEQERKMRASLESAASASAKKKTKKKK
jgi:hypothetical protein